MLIQMYKVLFAYCSFLLHKMDEHLAFLGSGTCSAACSRIWEPCLTSQSLHAIKSVTCQNQYLIHMLTDLQYTLWSILIDIVSKQTNIIMIIKNWIWKVLTIYRVLAHPWSCLSSSKILWTQYSRYDYHPVSNELHLNPSHHTPGPVQFP